MSMTEDAAKKKGCWINPENCCSASSCMAWKFDEVTDLRDRELWSKKANKRVNAAVGDDAEWRLVNPDEPAPEPTGYCAALPA